MELNGARWGLALPRSVALGGACEGGRGFAGLFESPASAGEGGRGFAAGFGVGSVGRDVGEGGCRGGGGRGGGKLGADLGEGEVGGLGLLELGRGGAFGELGDGVAVDVGEGGEGEGWVGEVVEEALGTRHWALVRSGRRRRGRGV